MSSSVAYIGLNSAVLQQSASNFTATFQNPIRAKEIALKNLNVWQVSPTITSANNAFNYYNGVTTRTVLVPQGLYQIVPLIATINTIITNFGDDPTKIVIAPYDPQQTTQVTLSGGYTINFNVANTIGYILGFWLQTITAQTTTIASQQANLTNGVNLYLVHCSCVTAGGASSYCGQTSDIIYSYSIAEGQVGALLNLKESYPIFIQCDAVITSITIRITDQNNNLLLLNTPATYTNNSTALTLVFR